MSPDESTANDAPPLVSFDPEGRAPIVSYNVPEPTAYAGRSYVELDVDPDHFSEDAREGTTFDEWVTSIIPPREAPEDPIDDEEPVPIEDDDEADIDDDLDVDEPDDEDLDVDEPDVEEPDVDEPDADDDVHVDEPDVEEPDVDEPDVDDDVHVDEPDDDVEVQREDGLHEDVLDDVDEEDLHEFVPGDSNTTTAHAALTAILESQFVQGESGPIVGAVDRRIEESVAAVGNATKLMREPSLARSKPVFEETAEGGQIIDTQPQDELLSEVHSSIKPNLYATESLSRSGSNAAELASDMMADVSQKAKLDVDVMHAIQPEVMAREMLDGRHPIVRYTMGGRPTVEYAVAPPVIEPRLFLVERYRLSTFLGNYGAGRTLKTFSLLPGEQTTISIETFRKTEEQRTESSSILDSYTTETAEEFEETVKAEQSQKNEHEESFAYNAEAKAEASWGFGSASASGGVEGGTNAAREEIAKNVSNATSKHAAEASSKRQVEIDTDYEISEQTGEETSIERSLENINLSRTLNFVFKQMNQEFITLMHLVDVRVGFTNNGFDVRDRSDTLGGVDYREVSLPELDALLADVIDEDHRADVRERIVGELSTIFDYRGDVRSIVEEVELPGSDGEATYLRVDPDLRTTYTDETGNEITVPGLVLSAETNVMRTEGVVVEALLGGGNALDDYAMSLQDEEVRKRLTENDEREVATERERLAQSLVSDGDDESVGRFERLFATLEASEEEKIEVPVEPAPEPTPAPEDGE
ncbi:hypothetical protein [Halovivax gelatinilyticus]|uniref:hypothetical protein n=1 Tax=Halovivax gelatinilyticus TaxID=2961597 RepID=UPI0020CA7547|nr:hypothetical protein [Halovivax gelatinilyticus]